MYRQSNRPSCVVSWLLLSLAFLGCSNGWNPLDPVDPPAGQPPAGELPPGPDPPQDPPAGPPPGAVAPRGILEVSLSGSQVVLATGYRLIIEVGGGLEPLTTLAHWPSLRWPLPEGTYAVRVEPVLDYCASEEKAGRPFSIVAPETTRIELRVRCASVLGFAAGAYERRPDAGTVSAFLSERFELQADGSFRLVYETSASHSFAYDGDFYMVNESPEGRELRLLFSPNGMLQNATATLQGDCLVVAYNLNMLFADFGDGTFCRS